jgi:hypothetical protein
MNEQAKTERTAALTILADQYIGDRNPMIVQIKQIAIHLECSERQAQRIRASIHVARGKPKPPHGRPARIREAVEAAIGDGDPRQINCSQLAREIGCDSTMVMKCRKAIIERRSTIRECRTVAKPKRERLFWTIGGRLFCLNRDPQEVGA